MAWPNSNDVRGWLDWFVTVRRGTNGSHGAVFFASWLLMLHGTVQIICNSKLFKARREAWFNWWLRLPPGVDADAVPENQRPPPRSALMAPFFYCPMCVGFWAGGFFHLVGFSCFDHGPLAFVLDGAAASAWCWFAYVVHKTMTTWLAKNNVIL